MNDIQVHFTERIRRTDTVTSFRFRPSEPFDFKPGQFCRVMFDPDNPNNKDLNKYLSFSCRPGKEYVELTKRLSQSSFSKNLKNLKAGDRLILKAPMGQCILDVHSPKIGFLVGGIGVTPVISMLEYITDNHLKTDICFLYSNMKDTDIPFKNELEFWSKAKKNFKLIQTVVKCEQNDKACFVGMINKSLIEMHMSDYKERLMYIFGPPGMVNAMKNICHETGCAESRLKAESFLGY